MTGGAGHDGDRRARRGRRRVEGNVAVMEYAPDRAAAWEVSFAPFVLHQRCELTPLRDGAATLLRLSIETTARGPVKLLLPLLRSRSRRTMARSLDAIATSVEGKTRLAARELAGRRR